MSRDFAAGAGIGFKFNTKTSAGAPITLAGTPGVAVYRRGSVTEDTDGVTLSVDYDGKTGLHDVAIDTSVDAVFYAAGNDFQVVLSAGTVDGVSVAGTVIYEFSLANRPVQGVGSAALTSIRNAVTGYAGSLLGLVRAFTRKIASTDAEDVAAITAINAGTVAGTFAQSADSTEALRDRGDAAWVTGGGGAGGGSGVPEMTETSDPISLTTSWQEIADEGEAGYVQVAGGDVRLCIAISSPSGSAVGIAVTPKGTQEAPFAFNVGTGSKLWAKLAAAAPANVVVMK